MNKKKRQEELKRLLKIYVIALAVTVGIIIILLTVGCNDDNQENQTVGSTQATTQETVEPSTEIKTEATTAAPTQKATEATTQYPTVAPSKTLNVSDGTGKKVYLTFDDGPSQNTDIILDTLKKYGVKATFFVAMPRADHEATIARYKRIIAEGHTLAVHSYTHDYNQIYASLDAFVNDVTKMRDYIYNNTGYMPTVYRFPGGSSNSYIGRVGSLTLAQAKEWLAANNFSYFDWNVTSGDANTATVEESYVLENIFNSGGVSVNAKPVSVVLMHDSETKTTTAAAVDIIVSNLLAANYEVLPITSDTTPVRHGSN